MAVLCLLAVTLSGSSSWCIALSGRDLRAPSGRAHGAKSGRTAKVRTTGEGRKRGPEGSTSGDKRKVGSPGPSIALSGRDPERPSGGAQAAKRGKTAKVRAPGPGRKKSPRSATWTTVPSLVGQSQSWAKDRATESGLAWECFADPKLTRPKWTVSAQSPAPGTKVKRGSRVIIWVAGLQGTPNPEVERKRAAALKRGARK